MHLYQLKFPYRVILEPLAKKMINVNPDLLGYLAAFLSIFTGLGYLWTNLHPWLFLVAIILIFARMTLNTVDGVIAIAQGKKDLRGEIVNALPDRYSDIFLFAGIAFSPYCNTVLGVLGMATVFLVSYTGMLGKAIGVNWQHQGPLGKIERLTLIIIASFLQYLTIIFGIRLPITVLSLTMILFIFLGQISVYYRVRGMLREIAQKEKDEMIKEEEGIETTVVVYDSQTGNTEKIARATAEGLGCKYYKTDSLPHPVNYYDLVVFGTPDIRANPSPAMAELLKEGVYPRSYALFVTYGLPLWGSYSSGKLLRKIIKHWKGKGPRYLGSFACPGFHAKYKTFKGKPSEKELKAAFEFGRRLRISGQPGWAENIQNYLLSLGIKTVGRLSSGISMSFKYGFTSGLMLDYIYENQPSGKTPIGKWIDRLYLENPGWEAIRKRKHNLIKHLKLAIEDNKRKNEKNYVLDVASGPARYLIETLKEEINTDISAVCQDIDLRWVEAGEKIAAKEGVKNISYQKGDAFDIESLAGISPRPNIIISSGFYDWITDDELVKKSLYIIYEILPLGGKIIFTNQAGHLSLDLVSKTFLDFTGRPLVMKTRPIELINSWAKNAGFANLITSTDKWGLYSVSSGEKI